MLWENPQATWETRCFALYNLKPNP